MICVKTFKKIGKEDADSAGGKGASLGEMTKAGIPVPPGFVILTNAFDRFIEKSGLTVEIDAVLNRVNPKAMHTVEAASVQIQSLITASNIPEDIANQMMAGFDALGSKFVAVRSSATSEDGISAAWAGQLDSFLNTTRETLLSHVKKCWASLFTSRAIYYRFEMGLRKRKISVAVIVQKMVESETSGIAFSVHPVTQDRGQVLIEAGFGLGEAVVSGQITPDQYVIEKRGLIILDTEVHTQKKELKRSSRYGNRWEVIQKEKSCSQKLSDKKIASLTKLIMKIEKLYGFPVDVEWAEEKNHFFITQSRPITTIRESVQTSRPIIEYLKSQKWFLGIRAQESLFFYSAKHGSTAVKQFKKTHGDDFAETILFPIPNDKPIRTFNSYQAKRFHAISMNKVFKDPTVLSSAIEKNDRIYRTIDACGDRLRKAIDKGDEKGSVVLFKKMIALYEVACAQGIGIFSLGLKLTEQQFRSKLISRILKEHDVWRNSVVFKEETMGETLFYFFQFIAKRKNLHVSPSALMNFFTVREMEYWLDGERDNKWISQKMNSRKKHGFVYIHLKQEKEEVIEDRKRITEIRNYFLEFDKESRRIKNKNELSGQSAYQSDGIVKGRVVIVKDKTELEAKKHQIKNRILVAVQTTPHYIPYMKQAKAIVTDEGGLTCHAAIIAREFKKPCIVGTKVATVSLKDGDLIQIDTKEGRIIKLKRL